MRKFHSISKSQQSLYTELIISYRKSSLHKSVESVTGDVGVPMVDEIHRAIGVFLDIIGRLIKSYCGSHHCVVAHCILGVVWKGRSRRA